MTVPIDNRLIAQLGWRALSERSWPELLRGGIPPQLIDLSRDLGQRNERPIRVFSLPTREAGLDGLAVPFLHDDGIVFDPSLLSQPGELSTVVARALAHLLYPPWAVLNLEDDYAEMQTFGRTLAPELLRHLPRTVMEAQPMVAAAMARVWAT